MKKQAAVNSDSSVLAVLHRAGKVWRALAASMRNAKPTILGRREFTAGEIGRLDEWLNEQQAGSVLCVLPSGAVICRSCVLPDAGVQQLAQALRLQAEAHVSGGAGAHRVGMAVLPAAPGEPNRTGMIVSWPESAAFVPPPTKRPVSYVADVAALGALLNGDRPSEAMLWLDRGDGSVALAMTHAGGTVFRATREDAQSSQTWPGSVGRIVAETALSVGHTGAFIETQALEAQEKAGSLGSNEAKLFAPREVTAAAAGRAQGLNGDPAWWSSYGVAVGALLARSGPLAELTHLKQVAPVETPSRIRTTLEALSRPRAATKVVIACALILMLGPLAVSGLRWKILEWRFGGVHEQLTAVNAATHQLAMYQELQKQKVWPMTKLLADITTNTPQGIKLGTIRIEAGKDFTVTGTVSGHEKRSAADVFALFQENLQEDDLFTDIKANLETKGSSFSNFTFDLSGKVIKPYAEATYPVERDFGSRTLAARMYGDKAVSGGSTEGPATKPDEDAQAGEPGDGQAPGDDTDPEEIAMSDTGDEAETQPGADRRARRMPRASGSSDPSAAAGEGTIPPSQDIPPPYSEEQIKAMSLPELNDAWAKVGRARQYNKDDKELQEQLARDFDMIKNEVIKRKKAA